MPMSREIKSPSPHYSLLFSVEFTVLSVELAGASEEYRLNSLTPLHITHYSLAKRNYETQITTYNIHDDCCANSQGTTSTI